jgi:hypothetical protein
MIHIRAVRAQDFTPDLIEALGQRAAAAGAGRGA